MFTATVLSVLFDICFSAVFSQKIGFFSNKSIYLINCIMTLLTIRLRKYCISWSELKAFVVWRVIYSLRVLKWFSYYSIAKGSLLLKVHILNATWKFSAFTTTSVHIETFICPYKFWFEVIFLLFYWILLLERNGLSVWRSVSSTFYFIRSIFIFINFIFILSI